MMHATTVPERRTRRGGAFRMLSSLLLMLSLGASIAAQDGNPGPRGFTGGGDEVGSLPIVQGSTGTTFIGQLDALRALHAEVRGRGRVDVRELARGEYAVTVSGNVSIALDRAALARTDVQVFFAGGSRFAGGVARLQILDSLPVYLAPERVPMPLGRLAGSRVQGPALALDLLSPTRDRAHAEASLTTDRVTILQVVR